jgi:hypothetical protein
LAANAIKVSRFARRRKTTARRVEPDDAADILARTDAKNRDSHSPFLLLNLRRPYSAGRRGGPFHKLAANRLSTGSGILRTALAANELLSDLKIGAGGRKLG